MGKDPQRYIGLDIHKEYFVAIGVNPQREVIFGPQKVSNYHLDDWIEKWLTPKDAVVLEMTTNTYLFYDSLLPYVCLLYTSDAADEEDSVDLGGRRIIK